MDGRRVFVNEIFQNERILVWKKEKEKIKKKTKELKSLTISKSLIHDLDRSRTI